MSRYQRLSVYLGRAAARPFRYGRHDCCTVAAGWALAEGGVDVLQGHSYTSLRDGLRQLEEHGMADHVAAFEASLDEVPRLRALAGDVAVLPDDGLPVLGIVMPGGERVWCFGPGGPGSVPLTSAIRCFRVISCE